MRSIRNSISVLALLAAWIVIMGCGGGRTEKGGDQKKKDKDEAVHGPDHVHGAGPHGGAVGDWGGGKLHFEFKPNHDTKEATVWILGSDEKTATPIKAKDGKIQVSIKGVKTKETFDIVLKADPQKEDPAGKSSRFVGKHDKLAMEQDFEGTVSGEDDGTPYVGDFKEAPEEPKKK